MQWIKKLMTVVVGISTLIVPSLVFAKAYGTVTTDTLNARKSASTKSEIVTQLDKRDGIEIVKDEQNGWFKIAVGNDDRAYVKDDFISIHRAVARVTVDGLNIRDYPSTKNSKVTGQFYKDDEISVNYKVGDWYKVSQEGYEGFVHKDFIHSEYLKYIPTKELSKVKKITVTQKQVNTVQKPSNQKVQSDDTQEAPKRVSAVGTSIVSDAKQFLGNPYVYGGNNLNSGVDCSGFVQQILKRHDIYVSRSSASQYANDGYNVSQDELQPGDLVFYGYNGRVSHVGIYIGGQRIIHAQDERSDICISNVFPSGGKPYIGAKRVK